MHNRMLERRCLPTFTGPAVLYSGASVLGPCRVGSQACIAAGVSVVNTDVPPNTVVLGRYPSYPLFRESTKSITQRPPFVYGG